MAGGMIKRSMSRLFEKLCSVKIFVFLCLVALRAFGLVDSEHLTAVAITVIGANSGMKVYHGVMGAVFQKGRHKRGDRGMTEKAKAFLKNIREKAAYVLGGVCAALGFALVILCRTFSKKGKQEGNGSGSYGNGGKAGAEFEKEKDEIEKRADKAYHAMRDHLSGMDACELCDNYEDVRDRIDEGKRRLKKRFDGAKEALHGGRGGSDD